MNENERSKAVILQRTFLAEVCMCFPAAHQRLWSTAPPSLLPPLPLLCSPSAPRLPAPPPCLPYSHRPEGKSGSPRSPSHAPPGPLGLQLLRGLWTACCAPSSAHPWPQKLAFWNPASQCGSDGIGRATTAYDPTRHGQSKTSVVFNCRMKFYSCQRLCEVELAKC